MKNLISTSLGLFAFTAHIAQMVDNGRQHFANLMTVAFTAVSWITAPFAFLRRITGALSLNRIEGDSGQSYLALSTAENRRRAKGGSLFGSLASRAESGAGTLISKLAGALSLKALVTATNTNLA